LLLALFKQLSENACQLQFRLGSISICEKAQITLPEWSTFRSLSVNLGSQYYQQIIDLSDNDFNEKHSSLSYLSFGEEEKSFFNIDIKDYNGSSNYWPPPPPGVN
jgi:hypothetical protein